LRESSNKIRDIAFLLDKVPNNYRARISDLQEIGIVLLLILYGIHNFP